MCKDLICFCLTGAAGGHESHGQHHGGHCRSPSGARPWSSPQLHVGLLSGVICTFTLLSPLITQTGMALSKLVLAKSVWCLEAAWAALWVPSEERCPALTDWPRVQRLKGFQRALDRAAKTPLMTL